jgi:hypothetical protein
MTRAMDRHGPAVRCHRDAEACGGSGGRRGTPFVPLEYRPKVAASRGIGWVDHLMRTDEFTGERVERAVRALYDDLPAARAALSDRVGSLAAEFHRYAAELREMLLA